jgi:hypothetical protein
MTTRKIRRTPVTTFVQDRRACAQLIGRVVLGMAIVTTTVGLSLASYSSEALAASPDEVEASNHIVWAWNNHGPCTQAVLCATYVDHFGITFKDGSFGAFIKVQRLTTSAHDCIVQAKKAKAEGNRGLAVEWVMASQIHNRGAYVWLRDHADAVITALDRVG